MASPPLPTEGLRHKETNPQDLPFLVQSMCRFQMLGGKCLEALDSGAGRVVPRIKEAALASSLQLLTGL